MLLLCLGLVVGLVLGLTGAGGSIFAVPLLMWALGWTLPQAAPVALLAVCAAATFGTVMAWDVTFVRYRAALLMAAAGTLAAPLGLHAARVLPLSLLTLLFAGALLLVGLRLLLQVRRAPADASVVRATVAGDAGAARGALCRLDAQTGRIRWCWSCAAVLGATGTATGFLAGLLGVGGGFVMVPALRAFTELSIHSAIATSLMAIALTSAGAVGAVLLSGGSLPAGIAVTFIAGTLAGVLAGRKLAPRIAGARLQQVFAVTMLAVAIALAAPVLA